MSASKIRLFLYLTILLPLLLSGCYTVPETGRSALNIVPEGQLATMSQLQFDDLKKREKISHNPSYNAMLRRVGGRIATVASADIGNAEWEFVVFDNDKTVNAFAMPGGKVGIYTGMFKKVVQTDDDLAVVIGHEIAHVAAHHGNERVSHGLIATGGGILANELTKDKDPQTRKLILAAYGAGSTVGYILPFSRYQESEADEIGLLYAARAGYDPRAAIGFWERMASAGGGFTPPEFLSTHPSGPTRIQKLQELMPKALEEYRANR